MQDEEDDHLCRVNIQVKVLEPTVAALADVAAKHCQPKPPCKTAGEQRTEDWVERHP